MIKPTPKTPSKATADALKKKKELALRNAIKKKRSRHT